MKDFLCYSRCPSETCEKRFQFEKLQLLKNKIFSGECKRNEITALRITEPRYCSKVLEGNWFEERVDLKPSVIPDPWATCYNTLFKPFNEKNVENFLANRSAFEKFKERSRGVGQSELLEHDGKSYYNNFSTSYDLTYRVLPNNLQGSLQTTYNSRKDNTPEHDLTQNYGNITGYGYVDYIKRKQDELIQEAMDIPHTHYQCDFGKKKLANDTQRFPRKRADINKPDLRHLDIDLEASWNPQFTHGYGRINFVQQHIAK